MSLYKSETARKTIESLYDEKLKACGFASHEDLYIETSFGPTHVIVTGPGEAPKVVVFHGINAGAPMAMEAIAHLSRHYRLLGIDTPGQANKSSERRLKMTGSDYPIWLGETLKGLQIDKAIFIGVSYGAFLLQKTIASCPELISKAIFIVPSGFVKGHLGESLQKLSFPLIRFLITQKDSHLRKFLDAFYSHIDRFAMDLQRALLLGYKMDYARPVLMKKAEAEALKAPVCVMVADNDVFFPGPDTLKRCQALFGTLQNTYVLQNSKHIPSEDRYPEIASVIENWLKQ